MFSKDTLHLWILGSILLLAGTGFMTVRHLIVPASFGQYGHFRGTALGEAATKKRTLTTREDCTVCHDKMVRPLSAKHARVHCADCHGQGTEHMAACTEVKSKAAAGATITCNKNGLTSPNIRSVCLHCHAKVVGRAPKHPQIIEAEHIKDNGPRHPESLSVCLECHYAHDPDPSNTPPDPEAPPPPPPAPAPAAAPADPAAAPAADAPAAAPAAAADAPAPAPAAPAPGAPTAPAGGQP